MPAILSGSAAAPSGERAAPSQRPSVVYDLETETLVAHRPVTASEAADVVRAASQDRRFGGTSHDTAVATFAAAVAKVRERSQGLFADQALTSPAGYPVATLGARLLGDYLLPFEIVSILLLVVMIGAAYLAKSRRRSIQSGIADATAEPGPEAAHASRRARMWT